MKFDDNHVHAIFLKISLEFQAEIPNKFKKIIQLTGQLKNIDFQFENIRELYRLSHNLAGSAKTFGIEEVATKSLALAKHVYPLAHNALATKKNAVIEEIEKIEYFVDELKVGVINLQSSINKKPEVNVCG